MIQSGLNITQPLLSRKIGFEEILPYNDSGAGFVGHQIEDGRSR